MIKIVFAFSFILLTVSCQSKTNSYVDSDVGSQLDDTIKEKTKLAPKVGATRFDLYLNQLKGKRVGLLVNHTSVVNNVHLLDTLISQGINIVKVYSPEHGFRGTAANGEKVKGGFDQKSGLPIISLYGKNKKPSLDQIADVDIVVFDIQDVGARFYTYISTMHYMMDACAKADKEMLILDRPNPNGMYIDGPIREKEFTSVVGLHPIPIVHGLTVAELALMINGEGWLSDSKKCNLEIVPVQNYNHKDNYLLPIKPSPNLPNDQSVMLYPSICLFEGTVMSVGRGTSYPFQLIGHPDYKGDYTFSPKNLPGTMSPKLVGEKCMGVLLTEEKALGKLNISWLIDAHKQFKALNKAFFINFIDKLAGTADLRQQIESGQTEAQIRESWKAGIENYKEKRKQYLLYEDFE